MLVSFICMVIASLFMILIAVVESWYGSAVDIMYIILTVLAVILTVLVGFETFKGQKCPKCHYKNSNRGHCENFNFCPECSTKLRNSCEHCGKEVPKKIKHGKYCPYCGKEIKIKVGEAVAMKNEPGL